MFPRCFHQFQGPLPPVLESRVREGVRSLLVSSTELAVAVVGVGWRIPGEGVVLEGVCVVEKVGVSVK